MEDVHPGDVDAISILASLLKELNILFANENQYVGNDTPTTKDSRIALLKQLILKWKYGKETVYRANIISDLESLFFNGEPIIPSHWETAETPKMTKKKHGKI